MVRMRAAILGAVSAVLLLGSAPASATAPSDGTLVIKPGTLRVDETGGISAPGLVKWKPVRLDGELVGTMNGYAPRFTARKIAFVVSPDRCGLDEFHRITVINQATAGQPHVEIDALAVLNSD